MSEQEVDAYAEWRVILRDEGQRRFLPQIHLFDGANMVIVMEFLGDCDLMDRGLVETGMVSPKVRSCLRSLFFTNLLI